MKNYFGYLKKHSNLLKSLDWNITGNWKFLIYRELTDTLIEALLFELNKIWAKREERILARVKASCAHEVGGLRR